MGVSQTHISEMEHGKRPIGKEMARRLAKVLKVNYRVFSVKLIGQPRLPNFKRRAQPAL